MDSHLARWRASAWHFFSYTFMIFLLNAPKFKERKKERDTTHVCIILTDYFGLFDSPVKTND